MGNAGPVYMAFDLGATSWRAMLGHGDSFPFRLEEVFRKTHLPITRPEGLFWDVQGIYYGMIEVLRGLARRGVRPASIGIDSWSVDYGLLDGCGQLLENPRCYRDPRNQGMADRLDALAGLERVFARTGAMAEDITTLCQLLAAREQTPHLLSKAKTLLFIPDLLRYWLCGKAATDFTLATTSQLYHLAGRCWDAELLESLHVPANALPPVHSGCTVLGFLSETIQKETGLGEVPVVLGASHDTAAAFWAAGADRDTLVLSSGTWSVLGVNLSEPLKSAKFDPRQFGYEGNADGSLRLIQNVPGMYLLEQCMREWNSGPQKHSHEEIIAQARDAADFVSEIDPFRTEFQAPASMIAAIQTVCRQTGHPVPQTPAHWARTIFRGLASAYARAIDQLRTITGFKLDRMIVVGGGSQNELLNEWTAEAAGVRLLRGPVEASVQGNLLCQQEAMKKFLATTRSEAESPEGNKHQ